MMILFRRILPQRYLVYANIFVSAPRRCKKNQFLHYFGLLSQLLQRQDLTNKLFEVRLKCMPMFLSLFWKTYFSKVSPGWFYCSNSWGNFDCGLWLWTFRLSIISIFCIKAESYVRRFLSAAFIENSKSYWSVTTTSTSYSREFERSFAEISSATFESLSNSL